MREAIVGTAGHIDHGKTALIQALTGIDTDRLSEEKQRGITIDIGFAHMDLPPYRVGFVDVPGHKKFVKNMLSGIGGIQLVLLVVAADESVMPQTVEHFHICRLLEIPRGVIVLTKKDLVDAELMLLVNEEVLDLVQGSFLEESPIVAVDSLSGEGLEDLKETLRQELQRLSDTVSHPSDSSRLFRLPVDRVFSARGFGTVITGTLAAGEIGREERVEILPVRKISKIRGIEIFNQKADRASAGQRTALNLAGVERQELNRGMILSRPSTFSPSHMFDVWVELLADLSFPLRQHSPIRFHQGSGEFLGRIHLLEDKTLKPGRQAVAQIRLDQPTVGCAGDHFVLRRYSPLATIGGGIILDGQPNRHSRKDLPKILPELRHLCEKWQRRDPDLHLAWIEYFVRAAGSQGRTIAELEARTGLRADFLLTVLKRSEPIVLIPQEPLLAVYRPHLKALTQRLLDFLIDYHERHPLAAGAPREEVKKRFLPAASPAYFQSLIEQLENDRQVRVDATTIARHGKKIQLNPAQQKIREAILRTGDGTPLEPPFLKKLCAALPHSASQIEDVYYFLLRRGELIRISSELVLTSAQLEFVHAQIRQQLDRGHPFSVADFKQLFGISRKYAIPLLEFLDRNQVTKRVGDQRVLI